MPRDNRRFQSRGQSPVYVCQNCGKRTRETGNGESDCEMCAKCFNIASQENSHTDNHGGRMEDCVSCQLAMKAWKYPAIVGDRWCDNDSPLSEEQIKDGQKPKKAPAPQAEKVVTVRDDRAREQALLERGQIKGTQEARDLMARVRAAKKAK